MTIKHEVYVIEVTFSESSKLLIYRRYSMFFDLHTTLLELFPDEAGASGGERIIPFLPGKKIFSRSQTHFVAEARAPLISEYVTALVKLPKTISQCERVLNFFEPTAVDIKPPKVDKETGKEVRKSVRKKNDNTIAEVSDVLLLDQYKAIADYKKSAKGEMSVQEGQLVEVVEKADTGWWFVSCEGNQGWVPATFLDAIDVAESGTGIEQVPEDKCKHVSSEKYTAQQDDEVSFEKNAVIVVKEKRLDGWWKVEYQGKSGWAPGSFLKEMAVQNYKPIVLGKGPAKPPAPANKDLLAVKQPPLRRDSINRMKNDAAKVYKTKTKPRDDADKIKSGAAKREVAVPAIKSTKEFSMVVGKPKIAGGNAKATHVTKAAYKNTDESGISFPADAEVEVVEADTAGTGWTYIKYNGIEGWAPSDYLNPKSKTSAAGGGGDKPPTPVRPGGGAPAKPNPPAVPKPPAKVSKASVGAAKAPPVPPVPGGRKPSVAGTGGGRNKVAAPSGLGAIIGGGAPLKPVAPKASAKPVAVPMKPKPPVAVAKPVKPAGPTKPVKPAVPTLPKKSTAAFPKVALSDYKGMSDTEVDLRKGEALNVSEVADDWSYAVRKRGGEGWVPSEFVGDGPAKPDKPAVPKPPGGKTSKQYSCMRDFKGETEQEISLKAGDLVTLIEPETDGWCFVSCRGKEGWVAADYLQQV